MDISLPTARASAPLELVSAPRRGWYRTAVPVADTRFVQQLLEEPGFQTCPVGDRPGEIWVNWKLVSQEPKRFRVQLAPAVKSTGGKGRLAETKLPNGLLRRYQQECVDFALSRPGGGAYLGLDLGVGKTRAATAAAYVAGFKRVLVVGPLIARGAWVGSHADPARCFGLDVHPLTGRGRTDLRAGDMAAGGWYFCHFDVLKAWMPVLLTQLRPEALIFDELDLCRSARSQHSRAVRAIARLASVECRIALSGTPIHNSVVDLWSQLDCIEPDAWGSFQSFGFRWASGQHGPYGPVYGEASNVEELTARLSHVYVRKTRREVLPELPPITRQRVAADLDATAMQQYRAAARDVRQYLVGLGRGLAPSSPEALARVTTLMKLLSSAKVDAISEVAARALDSTGRVVVFTWFRETAARVAKGLLKRADWSLGPIHHCVVNGDVAIERRLEEAARFAEHPRSAFIATIASAGTSLNGLQAASAVVIGDLWWAPSRILQAEGRVWRPDDDVVALRNAVNAYYLIAPNTVDEDLMAALVAKAVEADTTVGAEEAASMVTMLGVKTDETPDMAGFVAALERTLEASPWEVA